MDHRSRSVPVSRKGPLVHKRPQGITRVALAWQLTVDDLQIMFDDFTADAVPSVYRDALTDRLRELT